jgi:hypothetical protein
MDLVVERDLEVQILVVAVVEDLLVILVTAVVV